MRSLRLLHPLATTALLAHASLALAAPTAEQQYYLELINRARMTPAAELGHLVNMTSPGVWGTPRSDDAGLNASLIAFNTSAAALLSQWTSLQAAPALAWSDSLALSASNYSSLMASMDQQSHSLDGLSLEDRFLNDGYSADYLDLGENLYAAANSTFHAHAGFLIDWGDSDGNPGNGYGTGIQTPATHRELLMDPVMKEFGVGVVTTIPLGNVEAVGPHIVTEHLGNYYRLDGSDYIMDSILTGVVYDDSVLDDDFYTIGEGLSGYTVKVYDNALNTLLFTGSTNSAGGYNINLIGVEGGDVLRVELDGYALPASLLTINSRVLDYGGTPVTFYDNAYAAFVVVPEPSSALLLGVAGAGLLRRRRAREL